MLGCLNALNVIKCIFAIWFFVAIRFLGEKAKNKTETKPNETEGRTIFFLTNLHASNTEWKQLRQRKLIDWTFVATIKPKFNCKFVRCLVDLLFFFTLYTFCPFNLALVYHYFPYTKMFIGGKRRRRRRGEKTKICIHFTKWNVLFVQNRWTGKN